MFSYSRIQKAAFRFNCERNKIQSVRIMFQYTDYKVKTDYSVFIQVYIFILNGQILWTPTTNSGIVQKTINWDYYKSVSTKAPFRGRYSIHTASDFLLRKEPPDPANFTDPSFSLYGFSLVGRFSMPNLRVRFLHICEM